MPDWVHYVRQNLPLENMAQSRADDLVEEVARQLEDFYREARARGLSETEAERHAQDQIRDWESLTSDLYRTNARTRKTVMHQKMEQMTEPAEQSGSAPGRLAGFAGGLRADLLYGMRMLARAPGFTAIAVLTLGLGIGANATIFSMLNALVLQPLPFKNSHELVSIYGINEKRGWDQINSSYFDFLDFKKTSRTVKNMAAFARLGVNFSTGETPLRLRAGMATPGFFSTLGLQPILGRELVSDDQELTDERVVLINEDIWRRHYGAREDILGEQAILNSRSYTIIGVVPVVARLGDVWIPLRRTDNILRRSNHFLSIVGRLAPGATLESASTELKAIAKQLQLSYPKTNEDVGAQVISLKNTLVGTEDRAVVFALTGLVGLVLLIACANVAGLLLARASVRQKEIAIRSTLGASRGRLVRQMLTESTLLASLGGAAGLAIGYGGLQILLSMLPPYVPRLEEIRMDSTVVIFTLAISVLTGILFGLAPALHLAKRNWQESLNEGARTSAGSSRARLRQLLAVSQIAVALALLIMAGLFLRGLENLAGVELGFEPENVLTLETSLPSTKYSSKGQIAAFYNDVLRDIESLPQVVQAGATNFLYLGQGGTWWGFVKQGDPIPEAGEGRYALYYATTPNYLSAMQVPLRAGRYFNKLDGPDDAKVVLINQKMAQTVWPGEDPIGKQVRFHFDEEFPRTVVGVVEDTLHGDLDNSVLMQAYLPHTQTNASSLTLALRTTGNPDLLRKIAEDMIHRADPDLPVYEVRTMEDRVARQLQGYKAISGVLGSAGLIALALSIMGIFGVVSYTAQQRTHEFGIRLALGARSSDILRLVLRQGLALTLVGIALGLALAVVVSRLLSSALEMIDPGDTTGFIGVTVILAMVALVACLIPARRATKVDPMVALRYE